MDKAILICRQACKPACSQYVPGIKVFLINLCYNGIHFIFVELPIRLVEGNTVGEGRVEIWYKNSWATVCDDGWDDNDASAVCTQLGLGSSGLAVGLAGFGEGNGTILLDEVACTADQSNIFECRHNGFESHDCSHNEDAGVRCNHPPSKCQCIV